MSLNDDRKNPNKIRVSFILNPISMDAREKFFDAGKTIDEMLKEFCPVLPVNLLVWLNEHAIDPDHLAFIKPKPGTSICARAVPAGGKRTLSIIGGVASLALGVGGLLTGGIGLGLGALAPLGKAIFGGLATFGFGLTVKGLTPAPRQFTPSIATTPGFIAPSLATPEITAPGVISQQTTNRDPMRPSISGSQNQINQYGAIPRVYGKYKMFPPLAALTYTELVGDDQYLRMLFCLGYGPLNVTNIKIGDDLLVANPVYDSVEDVVGSSFQGVQYELIQGYPADPAISLFPSDVFEQNPGDLPLTFAGGAVTRTAAPNSDQLSVEVTFPNGLTQFFPTGGRTSRTVEIDVEYRETGSSDPWTSAGTITVTDDSTATVRRGLVWDVALGDYDVRLTRTTADNTDVNISDLCFWTIIRSLRHVSPFGPIKDQQGNVKGISLLALRIKATEQLNGQPNQINCEVESILPVYDGANWNEEATHNPAWILVDVIYGTGAKTREPYSKINTDSIMDWAEVCADEGRECNMIVDAKTNRGELARQIAAIGRAAFSQVDGQYGVTQDLEQAVPRKLFTNRNVRGFRRRWDRTVQPHALRCFFINPDNGWQQDEAIVYDDGYDADNATIIEELQLPGVTNYEQAWKEGRHHLAVNRLRPFTYEFFTGIEHIQLTRGDLISVNHDLFDWGLGNGRITAVVLNMSGDATGITIDGTVTMVEANNYAIYISKAGQPPITANIVRHIGTQTVLQFETPIDSGDPLPEIGDMYAFGLVDQETVPLLVKAIYPNADLSGAKIEGVDYAPEIYQAATGTIPPFTSHTTSQQDRNQQVVPKPILLNIRSNEDVLFRAIDGTNQTRIAITLAYGDSSIESWQAQYRKSGSESWTQLSPVPTPTNEISITPVEDGVEYDIRIRAINRVNQSSEWLKIDNYFVIGKLNPPPDVPSITLSGTDAIWSYPDSIKPPDFRGFYLAYNFGENNSYASSVRAHDAFLTVNKFDISTLPGGPKTLMVVAVDTSGNVSSNPAFIFVDQGDAIVANLVETYDFGAASYPGTITGGALDGGDLKADSLSTFWTPSDLQLFYPTDAGELFWDVDLFDSLVYASSPWFPLAEQLPARMSLLFSVTAMASLEYRAVRKVTFWGEDSTPFYDGDSDPFWDPDTIPLTDWLPWPGYLDIPADSEDGYQVRIVTHAGLEQGVVSRLIVQLDVEDLLEFLHDIDITAGGTRLPITKPFRVIKNIQASKVQSLGGSDFRNYETIDKDAVLGPLVELFDASHVSTSGRIDATIQGY